MSEAWISILQNEQNTSVLEHASVFEKLLPQRLHARPLLVAMIGGESKSGAMQRLTMKQEQIRPHGQIRVQVDPGQLDYESPLVFVDHEIHRPISSQENPDESRLKGKQRLRRVGWAEHLKSPVTRAQRQAMSRAVSARVLASFVGIFCYFASDLTGLQGVSRTIAHQAVEYSGPDVPATALPLVLVVVRSKRSSDSATARFLTMVTDQMRALATFKSSEAARITLHRHFQALLVVNDPESLDKQAEAGGNCPTFGEYLIAEAYEVELARRAAGVLYRVDHMQALLKSALDEFANEEALRFSALAASRGGNNHLEEFPAHLRQLLCDFKDEGDIWTTAVPLVASAIALHSCPPGMHFFEATSVFREYYFMHCLSSICSVSSQQTTRDRFMALVEEEFEVFYLAIASEPHLCTAKETHLRTLKDLIPTLEGLKSNKTCYCCLMRMPEKVLDCGHALCDFCVKIFGKKSPAEQYTYTLPSCVLCGKRNGLGPYRFLPPTAGVRMLTLDGGGVRGVIPLVLLQAIEQQVDKLGIPLREHFDLVCGTSSGGLIVLGLFFKKWSPGECLERFEQLARKLFKRRLNGSTIFNRLQEFILSYLADCRYDSAGIEDAIAETFGSDILMFNPLSNDTKVAITATTARDSSPCLFTNYNGRRRPRGTSYSVVRAEEASHDVSISEVARCTSAAPWYFKPKELKSIGTFQYGGLWLNNPLPAGVWELKGMYPEKGDPDYALSVGTGTVQKSQPIFKSGSYSPVRDSFLSRLYRTFMLSMDGEKTWDEFVNTLPIASRERYHRLNLTLESQHISVDDVSIMESLKRRALHFATSGGHLKIIRDAMLAAIFYFELECIPQEIAHGIECVGNIFCRINQNANGRRNLYSELIKMAAFFLVDGRPVPCVERVPASYPPFKRRIKFTVRDWEETVGITLRSSTMQQPRFISGLPKSVDDLVSAQQLYAPFGRSDHTTDKDLPPLPRKRKTRSTCELKRAASVQRRYGQ